VGKVGQPIREVSEDGSQFAVGLVGYENPGIRSVLLDIDYSVADLLGTVDQDKQIRVDRPGGVYDFLTIVFCAGDIGCMNRG